MLTLGVWLMFCFVLSIDINQAYGGYLSTHRQEREQKPTVEIMVAMDGHKIPLADKYAMVEKGKDIVMSCIVTGADATIQWLDKWEWNVVNEGKTYSLPSIKENQLQSYTCVANISTPEPLKANVILTVGEAPTCRRLVLIKGFETVKDNGKTDIRLDVHFEGVPEPEVTWYRRTVTGKVMQIVNKTENYQIIIGPSIYRNPSVPTRISSLVIQTLQPENYGMFYCDVKNKFGSCDSELLEFPVYGRECKVTPDGRDYIGIKNVTSSRRTCQRWDSNQPHYIYPTIKTKTIGQENYCRNPEFDINGSPWCYTMDPEKRLEECDIPNCVAPEISLKVLVNGEVAVIKDNVVWNVSQGSNLTFICSATGDPEPYYIWYAGVTKYPFFEYFIRLRKQKGGIDFFKGKEHTITNVTRTDPLKQTCLVDNRAFPPVEKEVIISLRRSPLCYLSRDPTVEMVDGKSVAKLKCQIGGDPKPEVEFYKKINKESEAEKLSYNAKYQLQMQSSGSIRSALYTLVINDFTQDDYGVYYCHARNEEGQCPFLSRNAEFTVNENT